MKMEQKAISALTSVLIVVMLLGGSAVALVGVALTTSFEHAYINVTDDITGSAVVGGSVKLTGAFTGTKTTDGNGQVDFTGLPAGSYKVTVSAENYYSEETTSVSFSEAAPKTYTSKSYTLVKYGTYLLDNGDNIYVSATSRTFDNGVADANGEAVVTFNAAVMNTVTNTSCIGTLLTVNIGATGDNLTLENLIVVSGQTLTTVTDVVKYTINIGNLEPNVPQMITFKAGLSGIVENDRLTISMKVDDTPTVTTDTGATSATRAFNLKAT